MSPPRERLWSGKPGVFVLVTIAAVEQTGWAAIRTVCEQGCDHTTIQAAINAAEVDDTIIVEVGTYRENLTIDRRGIFLQGMNERATIIEGQGGAAVQVGGNPVRLANLTITSRRGLQESTGIASSGELTLIGCTVHGHANDGIAIDAPGTLTMTDCIVRDNGENGVRTNVPTWIAGSTFTGNRDVGIDSTSFLLVDTSTIGANTGGGVISCGNVLEMKSCVLRENSGSGAISSEADMVLVDCDLVDNRDDLRGGAIEVCGASLNMTDCTLSGNRAEGANAEGGGAICNNGVTNLFRVNISDNRAPRGGAIFNEEGSALDILDSVLSDNQAVEQGGAIFSDGMARLTRTIVSGNEVIVEGGGGIHSTGTLTLTQCTIHGNLAQSEAGIASFGSLTVTASTISANINEDGSGGLGNFGTATLTNTTVSGNRALGVDGSGGIRNARMLSLVHCTVADNESPKESAGIDNHGSVDLRATMIAGNRGGGDCAGGVSSLGDNLDGDGTCGLNGTGDLPRTDPLLGPLGDNGGPTATHALQPGSPAIDAVAPGECAVTVDQRGIARAQGKGCDIGAFERAPELALIRLEEIASVDVVVSIAEPIHSGQLAFAYDPTVLSNLTVGPGPDFPAGTIEFDPDPPGSCGAEVLPGHLAVVWSNSPGGDVLTPPGTHRLLRIHFDPAPGARTGDCSRFRLVDCVGEPPITNILRGPNDSSIRAMAEDGQACLREVFVRGDPNGDGSFNITDPIFVLGFLFLGGPEPSCAKTADADDSGGPLNLTDAIFLLNWLFLGGPNPRPPFPDCRPDPTPDGLDCDRFVCGA